MAENYTGDFALVCEGVTDFVVLRNVIAGFFQGAEGRKPNITQVQPDTSPGAAEWQKYGGWAQVRRYLEEKLFRKAFQTNRFVVVQIDTDIAADLGLATLGEDVAEVIRVVRSRLEEYIGPADLETYNGRFIFAVCVSELECWLLPIWCQQAQTAKTSGCLEALGKAPQLHDALKKANLPWIRANEKNYRSYELASRDYRKKRDLLERGPMNPSLAYFLREMEELSIQLPTED